MDPYQWADHTINSSPRCAVGFTLLLSAKPYLVPPGRQARLRIEASPHSLFSEDGN